MPRFVLFLLLACATLAQADPVKTWNKEQASVERDSRRYWKEFKSRFSEALEDFGKPVSEARDKPDSNKEAVYDYGGMEALYAEAKALAELRGAADMVLAKSGSEKAAAKLFAELLKSAKRMDALEDDLADPQPDHGRYTFNQETGCRLWYLRTLTDRRVQALAQCAGALELLTTDAWKKASRADGKKSFRRRVFVVDAIAANGSADALPFLLTQVSHPHPAVRIAAIEAAAPHGVAAKATLQAAWTDKEPAVRRALLQSLPPLPELFGAVLAHGKNAPAGVERDLCVRYLGAVSRQPFGHDWKAWSAWYDEYKTELEGGKFDPKTIEVAEAKPAPDPGAFGFYGLRVSAAGAVFVIEGSQHIAMPADVDVQRTQWRDLWRPTRRKWEQEHPSQQAVLLEQFEAAAREWTGEFRWGMVTLYGRFTSKALGEKKPLAAKPRDVKEGVKLIDKAPEKGWCAPYQGLRAGAALGGKEQSTIDTIVLWATGDPAGGRYMAAEVAADAWNRFNRFRRLRVIAIRIGNRKEPAQRFMDAIAAGSGGVSMWAKKPPAAK